MFVAGNFSHFGYGTFNVPETPTTPATADLTVVKQISADDFTALGGTGSTQTLTFTLNTDPAATATLNVKDMTQSASGIYQGTVSFTGLTVGSNYTVTESSSALPGGVTLDSIKDASGTAVSNGSQTITIKAAPDVNTLTFVNDSTLQLTQDDGSTMKIARNRKWQKLPGKLLFTKKK